MIWFWLAVAASLFLFSFVMVFGAPYVPTLRSQQKIALELLALKPGQVFYDLGCGDGRLLLAAAKAGVKVVGYELNPLLAAVAWLRTRRYGSSARVVCGNFWRADISDANGVFVFLIDHHMKRLDTFLKRQLKRGKVKVVSYGFKIPGHKLVSERSAVFLYKY